jgi:MFS family permease
VTAPTATGATPEKERDDAGIWITLRESPPAVKALLAGVFVNRLGGFLQIFLVLFLTDRGFSAVQAGTALSIYGAGAVLGLVIGGALSDRLGPRRAALLSMAGTAALTLAILYVHNYLSLLTVVALVGAVGRVYRPAAATLLSLLTPKHRQVMIFAMYRLGLNLGTTAAPLIGAALISVSYNFLFWGEAVTALGYAVIAAIALPKRGVQVEPDQSAAKPGKRRSAGGFAAMMADGRYLLFLLAMLVNSVVYIQYVAILPLAMRAAGLATVWYGAVVALNGAIVITCELLMTKITQRLPARIVTMFGFTLLGGGMAVYALPWGAAIFVIGTLVWSLAEIVAGPTMFAYPGIAGPAALRGRYMGAAQAMFGLGTAIGPAAGVWVWNAIGSPVWLWCGAACLIGLAAAWWGIRRSATDPEPGPAAGQPAAGQPAEDQPAEDQPAASAPPPAGVPPASAPAGQAADAAD